VLAMPKGFKGLDRRTRTTPNEVACSITTDRRDDDVVEDSNLGQPLAVSAREANFRPRSNRGSRAHGWMGATMRDTQADVPSA
ncbi:UNVERIFIED_CONTAM: hypothetical protein KWF28_19030, partial [Acinetobacter baumannii]